jgi:hypothetical protein
MMAAQIERIAPAWVFVSHPLRWESPPPEIDNRNEAASATIMVLYPSGKYAEVSCTVYRGEDNRPSISRGDSHVVRIGTWERTGRVLSIKARTVYADVLPIGKPIPGSEMRTTMERTNGMDGWRVQSREGTIFRPFAEFQELDYLAATLACDRSFWNGHQSAEPARLPCADSPQTRR